MSHNNNFNACMLGNIACFFLSSVDFLNLLFAKKKTKKKTIFQEYHQSVKLFQDTDHSDVLLGLIWVQTVCKGYQQTTKIATSGERI